MKMSNVCVIPNVIDLREADISSINSKIQSWLYSDQFEKPEEIVIFRTTSMGGFNLHNVKFKSLAMLIRCFLETAINPKFLHSTFHTALFNRHVLLDLSWPDPGMPPYFSQEFFLIIRNSYLQRPNDVTTMSSRQWYLQLLEDNVTMVNQISRMYTPSRAELLSPNMDWENTWRLARLKGLTSEQTSFLWRLLHQLLPTLSSQNNPKYFPKLQARYRWSGRRSPTTVSS